MRNVRPAQKSANKESRDADIRQLGVVSSIRISTPNSLEFDGATAGTVAIATVVITAFGKALVGKAAEATWSLLANRLDATLPAEGKIQVVYRPKSANPQWELVVTYPDNAALKRDKKNHRIYLAIAEGFAMGHVPAPGETMSLLTAIPADSKTRPLELSIRHAG